jgi:hypothetical protein
MISPRYESAQNTALPACPACGAPMKEQDRSVEHGSLFVWYACTRGGCDGQWLSELSAPRSIQNWEVRNRGLIACPTP